MNLDPKGLDGLLERLDDRIMTDKTGSRDLTLINQAARSVRQHRKLLAVIERMPPSIKGALAEALDQR